MVVRLLNAVDLMSTLEGPQLELVPVEAVEGPKMAMLKKIGLVTLLKISPNTLVTYETKQTPEPQDVYLSRVCFVSQVTHIFWEIFNNVTRIFYFSIRPATILTIKVSENWLQSVWSGV
jgi:hypothetical protein